MYSVVLAMALTSATETPSFFWKHPPAVQAGCTGCSGCSGYGCVGVPVPVHYGFTGHCQGNFACSGGFGHGYSYYGTCDGGCYGVGHSWTNQVPVLPALPPAREDKPKEKEPDPDDPDNKTDPMKKTDPADKKDPTEKKDPDMKEKGREREKESALPAGRARVIVELPAEAKLFVDGHPTRSTTAVRSFVTPELAPGQSYYYEIRAEIEVEGQTLTQSRRIVLRPGQELRELFDDPRSVRLPGGIQPVGLWTVGKK